MSQIIKRVKLKKLISGNRVIWFVVLLIIQHLAPWCALGAARSTLTLADPSYKDQDDMSFWIHPTDPSHSTVIVSDKYANKVFVYDMNGNTLQSVSVSTPGNIDIRYGFSLGGIPTDIVGLNERGTNKIRLFKVDPSNRRLSSVDDGNLITGANYGFTLCRILSTDKYYAITVDKNGNVKQLELRDDGGQVAGNLVRSFDVGGISEGMTCDDETEALYISEEDVGLWKYDAQPTAGNMRVKITAANQNGISADIEGVSIYYAAQGQGYIILSSQGNGTYKFFNRASPHAFVGTLTIIGGDNRQVRNTDGIDVTNVSLGPNFPKGAFAVHNGHDGSITNCEVELVRWEDVSGELGGLIIDTTFCKPRNSGGCG